MVVPLGPGKFYGSSLPRPRIYPDPKFNADRVDPPVSVMDPLLSWANEAHWSMGGLSFKRLRLQGRIEGSVEKLRVQREKTVRSSPKTDPVVDKSKGKGKRAASVSPPAAPMAVKRRRYLTSSDEEDEDGKGEMAVEAETMMAAKKMSWRKGAVRKLGDDFERVAKERNGMGSEVMKKVDEVDGGLGAKGKKGQNGSGTRASPRLAKRSPN